MIPFLAGTEDCVNHTERQWQRMQAAVETTRSKFITLRNLPCSRLWNC